MSERKITLYLLSPTHADRRSKEKFFTAFGFSVNEWETLKNSLLRHVGDYEVTKIEDSPFRNRYVIEGIIFTPDSTGLTQRQP